MVAAIAVACLIAVLRWLMLAGLAGALGGLAGRGLARQYKGTAPAPLPPPWALRSSLLGLAAAAGLTVVIFSARALLTLHAHPEVAALLTVGQGELTGVECAAFALAAGALRLRQAGLSVLPLLAVVLAEAIRAHPEGIIPVGGALLSVVHVLPALMWAGMLVYTLRAALAWRQDPAAMRGLVRLYANAAVWLFAVVVLTGVVSALVLVPLGSLLTTAYGIMVIVKAVLVAAVAPAAIAGRGWLGRTVAIRGDGPPGPAASRQLGGNAPAAPPASPPKPAVSEGPARATRLECYGLAAVLAATAVLTVLTPPAAPARAAPARAAHAAAGLARRSPAG
ncbi:MAG: copper transport protein [Streptosporangiaceae bacterium]|nr:copper transport protein [Streptosporangiaceae bacterium]